MSESGDANVVPETSFSFNAGHTEDILALEGILEAEGTKLGKDDLGRDLLSIPPESMVSFLKENKESNPHAIATFMDVLAQELRQGVDPNRTVQYLKQDAQKLNEMREKGADPFDIEEYENYVRDAKRDLKEVFGIWTPNLNAALTILNNEEFGEMMGEYIDEYSNEMRIDKDNNPTSETHGEYLLRNLESMREMIIMRSDQLRGILREPPEFFAEHSLEPPQADLIPALEEPIPA